MQETTIREMYGQMRANWCKTSAPVLWLAFAARYQSMAIDKDLCFSSARRLLGLLAAREVSSTELTAAYLERIESINSKLNAVVTLREAEALGEAAESDRGCEQN